MMHDGFFKLTALVHAVICRCFVRWGRGGRLKMNRNKMKTQEALTLKMPEIPRQNAAGERTVRVGCAIEGNLRGKFQTFFFQIEKRFAFCRYVNRAGGILFIPAVPLFKKVQVARENFGRIFAIMQKDGHYALIKEEVRHFRHMQFFRQDAAEPI